jgi:hypothetical protein
MMSRVQEHMMDMGGKILVKLMFLQDIAISLKIY